MRLMASKADDGILAAVGGVTSGVDSFFADKPLRVMGLSEILALQRNQNAGLSGSQTEPPPNARSSM